MDDEETDLAVLIANLKGKKNKDMSWVTIAESCRRLVIRYGNSYRKVASEVGVSSEIIREVDSLNSLPNEVKKIILSGRSGLDKGYRIATKINGKKKQIEVAKAVVDLGTKETRDVIEYININPELSVEECKKRIMESKKVTEETFAILIPLNEEKYKKLKEKALKSKINPADLAKNILSEWLDKN